MDDINFDRVARLLARSSDRRALTATLAVMAAADPVKHDASARRGTRCRHHGRRCGMKRGNKGSRCKRCCSGFALFTSLALVPTGRRRCACRPDGMPCRNDAQCCEGVCNPTPGLCDDGLPADPPITCSSSLNFCQGGAQECGSTSSCHCVTTTSQEEFCTNGNFNCASNFGNNVTCQSDNDCFNRYGETTACVPMNDCPSSVPCGGSGGTVCAQICGS